MIILLFNYRYIISYDTVCVDIKTILLLLLLLLFLHAKAKDATSKRRQLVRLARKIFSRTRERVVIK